MARYLGPKARLCRREGTNLFGTEKYDRILKKRPHAPGKNPEDRFARLTEYGRQMREKQKAKRTYGILERQFFNYYKQAHNKKGVIGDNLLSLLEGRLDNVVYRAGFALTRPQARQLVSHGIIKVNDKKVNIPSFQVSQGDTISIKESALNSPLFVKNKEKNKDIIVPDWIISDTDRLTAKIKALPNVVDMGHVEFDPKLVVELYSRK